MNLVVKTRHGSKDGRLKYRTVVCEVFGVTREVTNSASKSDRRSHQALLEHVGVGQVGDHHSGSVKSAHSFREGLDVVQQVVVSQHDSLSVAGGSRSVAHKHQVIFGCVVFQFSLDLLSLLQQ